MNKFELFCLVFYALDKQWEKTKNHELGKFLSNANPFLFKEIGSAVADCYDNFCNIITDDIVKIEKSYKSAKLYIDKLGISDIIQAFSKISEDEWNIAAKKYLSNPHKGETIY